MSTQRITLPRLTIQRVRGDTWSHSVTVREAETGVPRDLTGATVSVLLAASRGGAALATATNGSGVTVVDAAAGRFDFSISLARETFDAGNYVFDVQIEQGGDVETIAIGQLEIVEEVTP